jgi:hypothetical protein
MACVARKYVFADSTALIMRNSMAIVSVASGCYLPADAACE